MNSPTSIIIPEAVHEDISRWAERAYPNEGCGLLIGRFGANGVKRVARFAELNNDLLGKSLMNVPTLPRDRQGVGAGRTEFVMNPAEYERETLTAEKEGLDVVGVIHTHPDHPARPSAIDASQPFLAQWSNIIVSVEKGRTREMKSWFREWDAEPFREEEIRVVAGNPDSAERP